MMNLKWLNWVLMGLLLVKDWYYNLKNKNEIYLFRLWIDTMMVDIYERYIEFQGLGDWMRGDCKVFGTAKGLNE